MLTLDLLAIVCSIQNSQVFKFSLTLHLSLGKSLHLLLERWIYSSVCLPCFETDASSSVGILINKLRDYEAISPCSVSETLNPLNFSLWKWQCMKQNQKIFAFAFSEGLKRKILFHFTVGIMKQKENILGSLDIDFGFSWNVLIAIKSFLEWHNKE